MGVVGHATCRATQSNPSWIDQASPSALASSRISGSRSMGATTVLAAWLTIRILDGCAKEVSQQAQLASPWRGIPPRSRVIVIVRDHVRVQVRMHETTNAAGDGEHPLIGFLLNGGTTGARPGSVEVTVGTLSHRLRAHG
jgi:hypothetical protein